LGVGGIPQAAGYLDLGPCIPKAGNIVDIERTRIVWLLLRFRLLF